MEFDRNRFMELSKQEIDCFREGTSLYEKNLKDYMELLKFKIAVQDTIFWLNRKIYITVIKKFIAKKINCEEFIDQFILLWETDRDTSLENCEPITGSQGFTNYMTEIFKSCDLFELEAQKNQHYDEKWLRTSVNDVLIQIQKEYNFN